MSVEICPPVRPSLGLLLLLSALVPTPSPALEVPVTAPAVVVPSVPGPATIPLPPAAHGPALVGQTTSGETVPSPLLEEIGKRQSELAVLELDLKRAELKKRLRELDQTLPASPPPAFPSGAPTGSQPAIGEPGPVGAVMTASLPVVKRVHRVGGQLRALLVMPSGETRDLTKGAALDENLHIVAIASDLVLAKKAGGAPFPLAGSGRSEP